MDLEDWKYLALFVPFVCVAQLEKKTSDVSTNPNPVVGMILAFCFDNYLFQFRDTFGDKWVTFACVGPFFIKEHCLDV